jgi:pimeloyl-ACP methyl ester carboxylesterase
MALRWCRAAAIVLLLSACRSGELVPSAGSANQVSNTNDLPPRSPIAHLACAQFASLPCRFGPFSPPTRVAAGPPRLPSSATREANQIPCADPNLGAACGYVSVPLDRTDPKSRKIQIHFELFTHFGSGPAQSAILWNPGGPGEATTDPGDTAAALYLMEANLDVHDLLLVDDRGRGYSNTIDCRPLQYGNDPFVPGEEDCVSQLGAAISRYGTGDIAQDTDAVRAALGYDKVDYFVWSSGGVDATAYATRYGSHVRSLVLDAPVGTPAASSVFGELHIQTQAERRMIGLACTYSPTCRVDHPRAADDLDSLVAQIRAHPLTGQAYDASGNPTHVTIDEARLLFFIIHNPSGNFVSTGEILAAGQSLRRGDPAPLLRLAAESFFPWPSGINYGDPTVFSIGADGATACADLTTPWSWSAQPSTRAAQYERAVDGLPSNYFAPFSAAAATGILYSSPVLCTWWAKPTPSTPITPPNPVYPNVPTLVLSGNMDDNVPYGEVSKVAALFPGSTLVEVAEAGHIVSGYSHCAANLESQFIETLRVGNIDCTKTPETVYPAVGRFPLLAKDALPAAVDSGNRVGVSERKAVTVAVAAVADALKRASIGSGDDYCLRAGTFKTTSASSQWVLSLKDCSFTRDVGVTGTVTWGAGRKLIADLTLSGSGTATGSIHIMGTWQAPGPVRNFTVSGNIGGLHAALLVPDA